MKRINAYKRLFEIEGEIDLGELKKTYRRLVKEWHPDKHVLDETKGRGSRRNDPSNYRWIRLFNQHRTGDHCKGTRGIHATTIENAFIDDMQHKSLLLELKFTDGSTYEYFGGEQEPVYPNWVNAEKVQRFARRNIFNSFIYRKSKRDRRGRVITVAMGVFFLHLNECVTYRMGVILSP